MGVAKNMGGKEDTNVMQLLAELSRKVRVRPEHPLKEYADLIGGGGIVDATRTGFSVMLADGSRNVEFDGGLTEQHYSFLAPQLEDVDKATLAQGVLENKCRHLLLDWDTAGRLLRPKYGDYEHEWLPQRVAAEGFDSIAMEIEEVLTEYRKTHPSPRLKLWIFEKPRFDPKSGFLYWGGEKWRFRKQPGEPVYEFLCALEVKGFPPSIELGSLKVDDPVKYPDQVKEARRVLHNRTQPFIIWHASDGVLSWEAR